MKALMKTELAIRIELRKLRLHKDVLGQILRIGIPAGVQGMIFSFANIIIQSAVSGVIPKNWPDEEDKLLADRFMLLLKEVGEIRHTDPASFESQDTVKKIQDFITENMYTCSDKILRGLC